MEQAKVIPLPQYEECEVCEGEGMRTYGPIYIDGDLYMDKEIMECETCGGTGKIKIQEEE
jgi:DnaJ-class molecular chaperone